MALIGLIGESPNDTNSVRTILNRKYGNNLKFEILLRNYTGAQLDSDRVKEYLRIEYNSKKPDISVFIRDLDGFESESHKIENRNKYFDKNNKVVNNTGVFLLAIYSLEALILYDIQTFNKEFNSRIGYVQDPMTVHMPKEYLMENTHKPRYNCSYNDVLFSKIDLKKTNDCRFLNDFFKKFEAMLPSSN